ncbi:sugar transporter SWEET1 [Antennarius striatus]|uniref:sugar transporter SWEET1 n=1 Tax=Antennarius striatus TaxID=241820 RepID=UPI0035B41F6B
MDTLQLLSWSCIVCTLGMFSTGLSDLKKMRESKSVDNVQFLPFLTTCLNNLAWLYFGVLETDQTLILVNTFGAILQIVYILSYFHYTKQKSLVISHTLGAATVLTCGWFYFAVFLSDENTRINQLGLTCSVVTISMYLSPLANLVEIVRSRSVQCLSFPLTVMTLLTSASWVLYGHQINNYYIVVPNTPGILTSLIRFYLFWKFSPANSSSPHYDPLHI